jgi:hypothetical protein
MMGAVGLSLAGLLALAQVPDADPAPGDSPLSTVAHVTPDPSHVGDLLTVEVAVGYPAGVAVNLPHGLELPPFHVVGVEESTPESTGTGLRKVFRVQLQHFAPGELKVPQIPLTWVSAGGEVHTTSVTGPTVHVEALLANEADPTRRPDDPPVSLAYPNTWIEPAVVASLAAVVVALFAAWQVRRWRERRRRVVPPPPVPAHVSALEALALLEGEDLPGRGRYQDFYLRLTEIVRVYLEARFGVEALDRTTDELRRELLRHEERIAPLRSSELVRFLQQADLVKFARRDATGDDAASGLEFVRDLVARTTPTAQGAAPGGLAAGATSTPGGGG